MRARDSANFQASFDGPVELAPGGDWAPSSLIIEVRPIGAVRRVGRRRGEPRTETTAWVRPASADMTIQQFMEALSELEWVRDPRWEMRALWLGYWGDLEDPICKAAFSTTALNLIGHLRMQVFLCY